MSRPKMTEEQKAQAAADRAAKVALAEKAHEDEPMQSQPEQELPSLADYIAARERDGVVLVRVTYPGAEPHVFPSKYSGVTVADGGLSCLYADGSTE